MWINRVFVLLAASGMIFFQLAAEEVHQWRGKDRSGMYNETGLLKKWAESGPGLVWESSQIGNGYGSPVITGNNIFINGEIDSTSYLFALDLAGKELWKSKIGPEWMLNYPGARTTPSVSGDLVYVTTGLGKVGCFETRTGRQKWSVDMISDLHGRNNRFGLSESVVVEGNSLFCMPGGADTNVVALDRLTGKIRWICKGLGQIPSHCSPLLVKLPQRNILVTFSQNALLGIDIKDGKLLWSHKQESVGDVHVNTPLYENGYIYYISGDGNGSVKLKLSEDGSGITQVWTNRRSDNCMGGFVKLGDYIYVASYERRYYYSLDANRGVVTDSLKFDHGTVNSADGMLYFYNERGQVGLVKPDGPKMEIVSSFKVTRGTKAHFAHPVISNGIMYIRHGQSLLAYSIKQNSN